MILKRFAELVPGARRFGQSYRAACPSCGGSDRSSRFAFTERDGKILLKCFAGCDASDVCESLGLELRDLFTDDGLTTQQRRAISKRPQKPDWRALSSALLFDSEAHWLKAERIFEAAQKIDPATLDDEGLARAWACLGIGFDAQASSEKLLDQAFKMRCDGLQKEGKDHNRQKERAA